MDILGDEEIGEGLSPGPSSQSCTLANTLIYVDEGGDIVPVVEVVEDKELLKGRRPEKVWVDISVARDVLGLEKLISPRESLKKLISSYVGERR